MIITIYLLLIISAGISNAQQQANFDAEIYSTMQGLSQHYIYAIVQDYKGFLWFGTKDGLNRFDGYSFKVYRNDPLDSTSLSDNYVISLFEDAEHNLWIGTASGGLNCLNRNTDSFIRYPNTTRDPVTNSYFNINALYCDDEGKVWIGTNGQGLFRYNPLTGKLERLLTDPADSNKSEVLHIYKIYKDREGRLWLTTIEGGLLLVENTSGEPRFKSFIPDKGKPGISGVSIHTVFQSAVNGDKSLWVGSNKGLMKFDPLTGKFKNYIINSKNDPDIWVWQIEETKDGALWISYWDELIKYYPPTGKYYVVDNADNPAAHNMFRHAARLYVDRSGVLWIGTTGYGILRYNSLVERFGKQTKHIRDYLLNDLFQIPASLQKTISPEYIDPGSIIEEPDSTLWISVNGIGIIHYSLPSKKIIKNYSHLCQPDYSLTNPVNVISGKIAPYFGHLLKRSNGELWISTEKGILKMNTGTGDCDYLPVYPKAKSPDTHLNNTGYPDISAMLEDADGVVWLGTPSLGLARIDPVNYSARFFQYDANNSNSLSSNAVLCIEQDPLDKNVIWIGTDGGGLNKFNTKTETFIRITEGQGLPNNVVYAVLKDKKNMLWISTNKGIARYNPATYFFRTYNVEQGLQDNEFNRYEFYQDLKGTIYLGGINGCNVFNPAALSDNNFIPPVAITDFKLFNKSISLKDKRSPITISITETKQLTLKYSQNVLTFEFSALEYSSPSNNNYAYKLEGFDNDWIYCGSSRSATYTNLDPGEYVFKVKASNNDGIWNESGTSLVLTITPPFWMTWWFQSLLGIIIISLITIVVVMIERRKVRELTRQAEKEAALERERLRIARDMHDDLGARLTEISMIGDLGMRNGSDAEMLKKNLERITDVARETVSIFDEIVWAVNPKYDKVEHIANYFSRYATEYLASADIRCKLNIPEVLPDMPVSAEARHNVLMVLKEVLNNIVKHAQATTVLVTMNINSSGLQFIISDNGKGFNMNSIVSYSEGISSIKHRMESVNGSVNITSEPGKGTVIELLLPLQMENERK